MMRKAVVLVLGLLLLAGGAAQAGPNATGQTIVFDIPPIDAIAIDSPSVTISINTADVVPGQVPEVTLYRAATYSITTNGTDKAISGSISGPMPPGFRLYIELEAPATAKSKGRVALDYVTRQLVTNIGKMAGNGLGISYTLVADPGAGVFDNHAVQLQLILEDM